MKLYWFLAGLLTNSIYYRLVGKIDSYDIAFPGIILEIILATIYLKEN